MTIYHSDYNPHKTKLVKTALLEVATYLGDYLEDIVVVGGLTPSLIIDQVGFDESQRHIGTYDLDIGFSLAVLDKQRYENICKTLQESGYEPDKNINKNKTSQRWVKIGQKITIDFLIPRIDESKKPGTLHNLTENFAALVVEGLEHAFENYIIVTVEGETFSGKKVKREIKVCNAGMFIMLKARAFKLRSEEKKRKDAYDMTYTLKRYGGGTKAIAEEFKKIKECRSKMEAMQTLKEDFKDLDSIGPVSVAEFFYATKDEIVQLEAFDLVREFIRLANS